MVVPQAHYDHSLLREHAYYENYDLNIVLDRRTFSGENGFKSIHDYGLGFFNYDLAKGKGIFSKNILGGISMFVYTYFNIFLVVYLILLYLTFRGTKNGNATKTAKNHAKHIRNKLSENVTHLINNYSLGSIYNNDNEKGLFDTNDSTIDTNTSYSATTNTGSANGGGDDTLEYHYVKV